jgi:hypothetical protein
LSNRRVNEHGICVAVIFQCSEKRDSDAKNNKRAFSPEATAYEKALALVASGVWHLLFPDQRELPPGQIIQAVEKGPPASLHLDRLAPTYQ